VDILNGLLNGFSIALQPYYLLIALVGAIIGTITGILPGLGPLGAMSILLSFTLQFDATGAMILFAGIYYGAMYGGSITSILLNIPGEAASVVTCIDGYQMARKGRAGAALTITAVASFVAGTISIIGLMIAATFLALTALKFGPSELLAIGICGIVILVRLSGKSLLKSTIMVFIGLAMGTVGMDSITGTMRYTFGIYELGQGIEFLPVAMGLFGIAEVLATALEDHKTDFINVTFRELLPTRKEWKRSVGPTFRGSVTGFLIGLIPGPAPVISTFVSYYTERRLSKNPEEFGRGAIEGVAGPESANNAAVGGAYVPLLGLGIPFTPHMAVVLGALMMHGITPGPNMMTEKPQIFWGLIASMYIGNFMLLILNLPLVKVFMSILKIPMQLLLALIVMFCIIGVYSINSSYVDLMVMAVFGVLGFAMRRADFEPAPLVLAIVIGPMIENSLRQALKMSGGDLTQVFFRPICIGLYAVMIASLLLPSLLKRLIKAKSSVVAA
jgi:putative tricarboxylic transport membrane protein